MTLTFFRISFVQKCCTATHNIPRSLIISRLLRRMCVWESVVHIYRMRSRSNCLLLSMWFCIEWNDHGLDQWTIIWFHLFFLYSVYHCNAERFQLLFFPPTKSIFLISLDFIYSKWLWQRNEFMQVQAHTWDAMLENQIEFYLLLLIISYSVVFSLSIFFVRIRENHINDKLDIHFPRTLEWNHSSTTVTSTVKIVE